MRKIVLAMMFVFLVGVGTAGADLVTFVPGTTNTTTALTGFSTWGDMMAGMRVTAYFANGTTQLGIWGTTGAGAGAAVGAGFTLGEVGDTFDGQGSWTLTNNSGIGIQRLLIDAGPGDTVFDTQALGDIQGTFGSERGWDFLRTDGRLDLVVNAYYRDSVALTGNAPVGDLFRSLDLQFGSAMFGTMTFQADTDNILYAGDITPVSDPASLLLLGTGLVGLVTARRRMRK
jgi:hypothetical protein